MAYRVKLQNFEGPLDLLLFLIKKNEVDIYDIPIAEITRQYLEYVELITLLDLEGAGDFILMAATLIRIKVQMLLPKPELEEEEEEDPRRELVQQLLEYKRFKEMALNLSELEEKQRAFYPRTFFDFDFKDETEEEYSREVTLFDLMEVFKRVVEKVPQVTYHRVEDVPVSVEEQMNYILQYLLDKGPTLFQELISPIRQKIVLVVTFVALLELIKRGEVIARQAIPFGEIWIQKF